MAEDAVLNADGLAQNEVKLPLHEDIMQLARLGEIGPIQKLLETGKYDATYRDEENITPLHVRILRLNFYCTLLTAFSGLQSIIITPFAST